MAWRRRLPLLLAVAAAASRTAAQVPGFRCGVDADCGLCVVGEACCCDAGCVANGDCCGSVEEYRRICEAPALAPPGQQQQPSVPPQEGESLDDFLSILCPPNGDCSTLTEPELLALIGEVENLIGDIGDGTSPLPPGFGDIPIGAPIDLAPPPPPPPVLDERECRAGAYAKPGTYNPGWQPCSGCPPPNNWFRFGECPQGSEQDGDRTAFADPNQVRALDDARDVASIT